MKITDGGVHQNDRGLIIMFGCCGTPWGGLILAIKLLSLTPLGHTTMGGLMKTLHRLILLLRTTHAAAILLYREVTLNYGAFNPWRSK